MDIIIKSIYLKCLKNYKILYYIMDDRLAIKAINFYAKYRVIGRSHDKPYAQFISKNRFV